MKILLVFVLTIMTIGIIAPSIFAAVGDITAVKTQSKGNNLEHDENRGEYNSLVQVDSDTYALAYTGDGQDGFIKTFTLSSDGSTITEVASVEHDTTYAMDNSLVQVDSDTYALAYAGTGVDGFISTFTISSDGSTITEVASVEHDENSGTHNSLVQVDSDTYALAYRGGAGSDGFISTFTISSDGSTITEVNSLNHDSNSGRYNSLVQVDSDTYALAYRDNSGEGGIIKTFTISSDGSTITEVVSVEHDEDLGEHNSLVQVDSDTYALAYAGAGGDGFISTFTISSDGSTITEVASVEHDENSGLGNSLVHVNSDTYALAYAGDGSDGYISTFTISSDGSTITEVASVEHDENSGTHNSLVQVDSDTYALAYAGDGSDGYISTFTIEIPVTETATATTSGGGNQSCNSRGFGVGKSLAVYEVSYNVCGNNKDVDILAYSTCGAIRAEITTEYGRSSAGLSLDQPFIDDEITIYTSILQDDIKSFTVKMENKRNEFEEKFIINECKGTKRYSQTTGYTSSQQGTFGDKGVTVSVPTWVKNTSGWWSDDRISENEFVKGIEYLIKERIIDTVQTSTTESTSSAVPLWVKNNAGWWAEGQIDDNSFVQGIEYLVKVGIIKVA